MKKPTIQELKNSIRYLEEMNDDPEIVPQYKEHLPAAIKEAKRQLAELEEAKVAEAKAEKQTGPFAKQARANAKKKTAAATKAVKKMIPSLRALVKKSTKLKGYRGTSERDLQTDADRRAKKPGSRVSKSGNVYREYRTNRSDVSTKRHPYLAKGGEIPGDEGLPTGGATEDIPVDAPAGFDVFGYQTKHFTAEVTAEFQRAIDNISEEDTESLYYNNTSTAFRDYAEKVDNILALEKSANQGDVVSAAAFRLVVEDALLGAIYNYKSGLLINPLFMATSIENIAKHVAVGNFSEGGTVPFMQSGAKVTVISERVQADQDKLTVNPELKKLLNQLMKYANQVGTVVSSSFATVDIEFPDGVVIPVSKSYLQGLPTMARGGRIKHVLTPEEKKHLEELYLKHNKNANYAENELIREMDFTEVYRQDPKENDPVKRAKLDAASDYYQRKTSPFKMYARKPAKPKKYKYEYFEGNGQAMFSVNHGAVGNEKEIWVEAFDTPENDIGNYEAAKNEGLVIFGMKDENDIDALEEYLINNGVIKEDDTIVKNFKKGGKVGFGDKVKAISKKLKGKKVPAKYRKKYGTRYSADEARLAAQRITGSITKKERKS